MDQTDQFTVPEHRATAQTAAQGPAAPATVGWLRRALSSPWRRPGLTASILWLALVVVAAFAPGLFTSTSPLAVGTSILAAPSWHHLFGTDNIGRDQFSRMVYGSSLSMRASLIAISEGLVVGAPLGLAAGYFGGWLDALLMRFVDVLLAIPSLLLSLAVVLALGFGITNVALAVGVVFVATSARLARGEVIKIRQNPYVEAARTGGARRSRVLWKHVLPNAAGPVVVLTAMSFGDAILTISSLGFLGFGVQPPTPEWGSLVADGRDYLQSASWLITIPGLAILATVVAANRVSRELGGANS